MKTRKFIGSLITIALLVLISFWYEEKGPFNPSSPSQGETVQIVFPSDKYPETAKHIQEAIAAGESSTCTINRDEAEENRSQSLKGVPTKKGYDRDEWPMAMCAEGGAGADIKYITPSDNRGAGSWVGNRLEDYANGTRVEFIFK